MLMNAPRSGNAGMADIKAEEEIGVKTFSLGVVISGGKNLRSNYSFGRMPKNL